MARKTGVARWAPSKKSDTKTAKTDRRRRRSPDCFYLPEEVTLVLNLPPEVALQAPNKTSKKSETEAVKEDEHVKRAMALFREEETRRLRQEFSRQIPDVKAKAAAAEYLQHLYLECLAGEYAASKEAQVQKAKSCTTETQASRMLFLASILPFVVVLLHYWTSMPFGVFAAVLTPICAWILSEFSRLHTTSKEQWNNSLKLQKSQKDFHETSERIAAGLCIGLNTCFQMRDLTDMVTSLREAANRAGYDLFVSVDDLDAARNMAQAGLLTNPISDRVRVDVSPSDAADFSEEHQDFVPKQASTR